MVTHDKMQSKKKSNQIVQKVLPKHEKTHVQKKSDYRLNDEAFDEYHKFMQRNIKKKRSISSSSQTSHRRRNDVIDKSKPYGFRTSETNKILANRNPTMSVTSHGTKYTKNMQKVYRTNNGNIRSKIFDEMFKPTILEPSTDARTQQEMTQRLLKHTDKIRQKTKLKKLSIEMEEQKKAIPERAPKPIYKSTVVGHDYRMYDYQMKMEMQRKTRVIELVLLDNRKERLESKHSVTNPRSKLLASKKQRKGKVYDRLFEESKEKQLRRFKSGLKNDSKDHMESDSSTFSDLKQCTFQPNVDSNFKRVTPKGKVEERLINDAKKRMIKKISLVAEASKIKTQTKLPKSAKTQEYAFKKFLREYEEALIDMNKEKGNIFSFEELCLLLFKLGFISERDEVDKHEGIVADVWIILGGEAQDEVLETSIYHSLCVIMNFDQSFLYTTEGVVDPSVQNEADKNTVGLIGKDGVFYLRNQSEIQRLHGYFYDLTFNRINYINKQSKVDKMRYGKIEEMKDQQRNSFKPKIDLLSKTIEESKNEMYGKIPRHNLLLAKGEGYHTKRSDMVTENKDKELVGCTFKPVINKNSKYLDRKNLETKNKMGLKETKQQFWDSIIQQKVYSQNKNKGKKLKPKVNKIIMDILPGKDPIIQSQEVLNEYNSVGGISEHGENQQSISMDEKTPQSKSKCWYKPFSPSDGYEEKKKKDMYHVAHNGIGRYVANYMDQEFEGTGQEAKEQFIHNQDERVSMMDRKLSQRYEYEHGEQTD
jgi:hypothetical protein